MSILIIKYPVLPEKSIGQFKYQQVIYFLILKNILFAEFIFTNINTNIYTIAMEVSYIKVIKYIFS